MIVDQRGSLRIVQPMVWPENRAISPTSQTASRMRSPRRSMGVEGGTSVVVVDIAKKTPFAARLTSGVIFGDLAKSGKTDRRGAGSRQWAVGREEECSQSRGA